MSLTTDTTMQVVPAYGGGGNSMWGGDWASWIVLFLIFGMFGWGGNGCEQGGNPAPHGCGMSHPGLCGAAAAAGNLPEFLQ